MGVGKLITVTALCWVGALVWAGRSSGLPDSSSVVYAATTSGDVDGDLEVALTAAGFTGNIQDTFQQRIQANLGRKIDPRLADLGRMLWFDKIHSLHRDNTCGGCHSPTN
jgi:cytochrome c peroxidase